MQCARCGAILPATLSSCPVCAEPVASAVSQGAPLSPVLEPTLQAANGGASAPFTPVPPATPGYEGFSFAEFAAPVSNQAGSYPYAPTPGQFSPAPVPVKKRPTGMVLFSICLVVLLLGAGIGTFAYFVTRAGGSKPVQQVSAQITPTVSPMQLYNQATGKIPVIDDSLAYPSASSWHNYQQPKYQCAFKNKAFEVSISDTRHFFFCQAHTSQAFTDFAFQVQMTILQGDYGGVVFRADPAADSLYLFRVDQDGTYNLFVYPDRIGTDSRSLVRGTAVPFKIGDNQSNVLTVIAQGSHIYLYINAQYIAQATDTTLTRGLVGLAADDVIAPTAVAFSYAKLWMLSSNS